MVRSSLLLVVVAALVGVWLGRVATPGAASVWALLVGLAAGGTIFGVTRARTRSLARDVNAWMGKFEVEPVDVGGGSSGAELATALNALGSAYARRGQRLRDAEPRLAALITALPEPALLFDRDLALVALNDPARQVFHIAAERAPVTATTALGSAALAELVRTALQDRGTDRTVARVGARTLEAVVTVVDGQVLVLARDLTETVRVEALRRDFVANASHELKTPVAGIQSLVDALDIVVERDPAKARSLLGRVRAEADRLATLVSDLLSLRRVDDDVDEAREQVDLERVVAEVIAELTPLADEGDVEVSLSVDTTSHVLAVPEDIRLVVGNLVENAIKYNQDGGDVSVRIDRDQDHAVLVVKDTGIGIPGKDLDRIFERFYRVDPGRSREAGGTGLGLSIVRHAVERNGGRVSVSSLLGKGSTFTVRLPATSSGVGESPDEADPARG